jgi:hypothetical protein
MTTPTAAFDMAILIRTTNAGLAERLPTRREWFFSRTAIPAINYTAVGVYRPQARERYDRGGRGGCGPAAIA